MADEGLTWNEQFAVMNNNKDKSNRDWQKLFDLSSTFFHYEAGCLWAVEESYEMWAWKFYMKARGLATESFKSLHAIAKLVKGIEDVDVLEECLGKMIPRAGKVKNRWKIIISLLSDDDSRRQEAKMKLAAIPVKKKCK